MRIVMHGARADRQEIRDAVSALRDEGHDVDVRVTWEAGQAALFASEAAADFDVVVAAGGDGTVSEVTGGLMGVGRPSAALAILPLGTANDFATSAEIPLDDVEAALRLAVDRDAVHAIDVIRVDEHIFLNMATGGPGTQLTVETPKGLKRVLGGLSYVVAGIAQLASFEPQHGSVRGPGFEWSGAFLALAVGNGRQAGGGMRLCPDALVDDGRLDIRIIPEGDGAGALALDGLLSGREVALDEASIGYRAEWVEIETSETLHLNLDGEPREGTHFRFETIPGALRAVLPTGSPLLG